jgi:hypothetical protein
MVLKEMVSMELKGQPGAALHRLPSNLCRSVMYISVSPPPVVRSQGWVLYIVVFRSRWFRQAKVCSVWTHEEESGSYHMGQLLGFVVDALFHLVAFPVNLFFSWSSNSRKNDGTKRLGPFDILKVPKSQKHAKTSKYAFAMLKLTERGLFRKSPHSMENMSRSLINYRITKNLT